eukprot:sb/3470807/
MVDCRGTPGRDEAFSNHDIYKNLGNVEIDDFIKVARRVRRLSYVKKHRMGIYGASYGGYFVLRVLEKAPHLFRSAVASAAVADWKLYDSAYSERYMGLYNKAVYERASVLPNITKIPKKTLLLMHGLSDHNVLPMNHWVVTRELNKAHIEYREFVKPMKGHSFPRLVDKIRWFRDTLWDRRRGCGRRRRRRCFAFGK